MKRDPSRSATYIWKETYTRKRDEHYGKRPIKEGCKYMERDLYYEQRRILWKETQRGGLHIYEKRSIL